MRRHRGPALAGLLLLSAALLGLVAPSPARASCAGPSLGVGTSVDDAAPPATGGSLSPGQALTVTGVLFHSGCDDTSASGGCSAPPPPTEAALHGVELVLQQDGSTWVLDEQDAAGRADRYSLTWRASVPEDVGPGPAVLTAGSASLPVTITAPG